ncbi:alpha/beta hydrolase family protein [Flavobacterium quisquiliarum]|uniref:Alpha/beta hydrolase family protein n=1 Tax=Flavobacterium quisquiliarum TaxID=1834436 RepID=A0ABV8W417_9FLAO|nr:prolyl oligopeptidase family serine peptidase [Flavobacterium quisquiliarum]MBW1656171.1 prolyl oligopeptidase family serine peptidase [Flavobacterium quisquiliarum]
MGHSFGGYETAFIVTQTPMFAAAVAGGAITDLNSFYYSVGRSGNPNMWRFEKELWNMGGPPNELALAYHANSPIVHAEKIQNPLLIWTGKADAQVNYSQSLELYLALRRFKKKSILLVYPEEDHVLMKPENQTDITLRILDWFAYFLKDDRSAKWITDGTR